MYDIIIHSDYSGEYMKNHTKETDKERLAETVDKLTEENQRCFLEVLGALTFAQSFQNQADSPLSDGDMKACFEYDGFNDETKKFYWLRRGKDEYTKKNI
jgi:hypothetical protein